MVGVDKKISFKKSGDGIVVTVPPISINSIPCRHAYVLKITDIK
jgi:hypothetical protein